MKQLFLSLMIVFSCCADDGPYYSAQEWRQAKMSSGFFGFLEAAFRTPQLGDQYEVTEVSQPAGQSLHAYEQRIEDMRKLAAVMQYAAPTILILSAYGLSWLF